MILLFCVEFLSWNLFWMGFLLKMTEILIFWVSLSLLSAAVTLPMSNSLIQVLQK